MQSVLDEHYDFIIIGGGITGAGIARDASHRGLKVALFEKGDFASGTSSKSSKLVHGGLRYLQQGEIGLVRESVKERELQSKVAPHLVRPLPFLLPLYRKSKPGLFLTNIGLWIYEALAGFRSYKRHQKFRGADKVHSLEPLLSQKDLKGALLYYDCATDDARLTLENIIDAQSLGADCFSYHQVVEIVRNEEQATGAVVKNLLTGSTHAITANCIVVAAGAWSDEAADSLEIQFQGDLLRRTKGVHLVFPKELLPVVQTATIRSAVDGRVMFVIPWRDRIVVGTTDTDYVGSADDCHATAEDAQYICDSINPLFETTDLTPGDAISSWAGLRPLIRDTDDKDESSVSREHNIFVRGDGIILIAGGKLTTYRVMAEEVVDKTLQWLGKRELLGDNPKAPPEERPLPGAQGLTEATPDGVTQLASTLAREHQLDAPIATHLAQTYGVRAWRVLEIADEQAPIRKIVDDLPFVWTEIKFACLEDMALTLSDIFSRRVPLLLTARDLGQQVLSQAANIAGGVLGWDESRRDEEVAQYLQQVAFATAFKTG